MAQSSRSITDRPSWKALQGHADQIGSIHLRDLFKSDPDRAGKLSLDAIGIHLD